MDIALNALVNEALLQWAKLVGLKEDPRLNGYELNEHGKDLNESRILDPSGLTTFLMLRGLTDDLLGNTTFTARDLIKDREKVEQALAPMRSLFGLLEAVEAPRLRAMVEGFQADIERAAHGYGVPAEKMDAIRAFMAERYELALVRRDSFRSMETLEAHQFTQGDPDPDPVGYNLQIFEFWNIHSLIRALASQKVPGITLALIRDPEEPLSSFFAWAIRNGGTITILTDRSKDPHPAYKRMSRRPDRNLSRRAARHWFPYQLLDLEVSEDQKRMYAKARTALVPVNADAVPIARISDLEPEQIIWMMLMLDQIKERYWREDRRLPELAYTGEMIKEPLALETYAGALVRRDTYKPLELAPLTRATVTAATTEKQWQDKPLGFNRWMVERYGHQVPETVFNLLAEGQKDATLTLTDGKVELEIGPKLSDSEMWRREYKPLTLETMNALSFGSAKKMEEDRLWAARMNQMKLIKRLAEDEFEREKDTVMAWLEAHIKKNSEMILTGVAREELVLPTWEARRFGEGFVRRAPPAQTTEQSNAIKVALGPTWAKAVGGWSRVPLGESGAVIMARYSRDKSAVNCFESGAKASVFATIYPTCPEALAALCGVTVEELPWALQHWYSDTPYVGNAILERLDPEDWLLKNPWMEKLKIRVGVALSKSAFNRRRKALGLPRKEEPPETPDPEEVALEEATKTFAT